MSLVSEASALVICTDFFLILIYYQYNVKIEHERSRQEKEAWVGWVIRQIQIGGVV